MLLLELNKPELREPHIESTKSNQINLKPTTYQEISNNTNFGCKCLFRPDNLLVAFKQIAYHIQSTKSADKNKKESFLDVDVECDCMTELVEWFINMMDDTSSPTKAKNLDLSNNDVNGNINLNLIEYIGSLEKHLTRLESNFTLLENNNNNLTCSNCSKNTTVINENMNRLLLNTPDSTKIKQKDIKIDDNSNYLVSSDKEKHLLYNLETNTISKEKANNSEPTNDISTINNTKLEQKSKVEFNNMSNSSIFTSSIISSDYELESFYNEFGINANGKTKQPDITMEYDYSYYQLFGNETTHNKSINRIKSIDYKNEISKLNRTIQEIQKENKKEVEEKIINIKEEYKKKFQEFKNREQGIIKKQNSEIEYMKQKLELYRNKVKQLSDTVNKIISQQSNYHINNVENTNIIKNKNRISMNNNRLQSLDTQSNTNTNNYMAKTLSSKNKTQINLRSTTPLKLLPLSGNKNPETKTFASNNSRRNSRIYSAIAKSNISKKVLTKIQQ